MTDFRLPSLDWAAPIVDVRSGRVTPYFQRFWQNLKVTAVTGANATSDVATLQSQVTTINGQISTLNSGLAGKAPLASPSFTGAPTAPTPTAGDNDTSIATTAFVTTAITNLIGGAPGALDTLNELATAINDDASFAATVTTALGGKLAKSTFSTWVSATGTAERATFATYTAPTISASPTQAEVQALADHMQILSRRMKALIDDVKV